MTHVQEKSIITNNNRRGYAPPLEDTMKNFSLALHIFAGFILILGGVAYIDDNPVTILHTLIGFGLSLAGIVLWILGLLLGSSRL